MVVATRFPISQFTSMSFEDSLAILRDGLAGELITSGSPEFDEARHMVAFATERRPLAIVRAANAHDVAAAVDFAREHGLPLAVRSGGHSLAHLSVIDGAVVVDLSGMKGVSIDPEARTAPRPGGRHLRRPRRSGATRTAWRSPPATPQSVGMGGLTTGGGIGFMVRKYGLAIDNLLSAQVVTAGGAIVTASAQRAPGPLLGDPRRRRQLRHHHRVHLPPGPRRADPRRR